jgi:hypothetical protein
MRAGHLDHERALPPGQLIARAHAGKDPIGDAHRGLLRRHETADLRHQRNQGHLADERALAGHVGARDEERGGGGPEA